MANSHEGGLGLTRRTRWHHAIAKLGKCGNSVTQAPARRARRWQRVVLFFVVIFALPGAYVSMLVACTHGSQETDPPRSTESTSAAPPSAVAPPSAPSSAVAPPSAAEPIVVSIDALPLGAKIFLDGVVLETNPYEVEHPRDARSHVVRVEAHGYKPQSANVAFSGPVHMHVELVPLGGSAPPVAQRPPAKGPAPAPSAAP